jgi:hypothetical protein
MRLAKPYNIKRSAVVRMMGNGLFSAYPARLLFQASVTNGIVNGCVRSLPFWELLRVIGNYF